MRFTRARWDAALPDFHGFATVVRWLPRPIRNLLRHRFASRFAARIKINLRTCSRGEGRVAIARSLRSSSIVDVRAISSNYHSSFWQQDGTRPFAARARAAYTQGYLISHILPEPNRGYYISRGGHGGSIESFSRYLRNSE